jgi:outer membrane protein insertion porin family
MRFPRLFVVVLLHIVFLALSSAAVIRSLEIAGNTVVSSREVSGWLSSKAGGTWNAARLAEDCRTIETEYRKRGYLAARTSVRTVAVAPDSSWCEVILQIDEGRAAILGTIHLEGVRRLDPRDILAKFDTAPGEPLLPGTLSNDIEELLSRYESMGYPYVTCRVDTLTLAAGEQADTLGLGVFLDEGRQVRIGEISVEGLRQTKQEVVLRETRIQPGELFNPARVRSIRQRLQRLNLFASVDEPYLYERNGRDGILIAVREGNSNTFDGVVGYLPGAGTGSSSVTGLVSVVLRNLFGTGRKLNVRWAREDRFTQEIGLRYQEPWLFGQPVNMEAGFLQRQQDSTFVRRTMDLSTSLMFSEELSASLVLTADRIIPSADLSGAATAGVSSVTGGIEILYDTRDDVLSATTGVRYRADYHAGRKSATIVPPALAGRLPANAGIQRIGIDLEAYINPFRQQVIAIALHGRQITTDRIQPSEMERFGGATTLRGYREREFIGSRIAWTNLEYRLVLGRRSSIYAFFDTGYYFQPADDLAGTSSSENFLTGYGLGMRVDTPMGYLGVSYALGKGDSFGTGKIHISLNNDF